MMIRLASCSDELDIRHVWKVCFNDTDEYIELFFGNKFEANNTLVCIVNDRLVAALQMISYRITCYGTTVEFYYLAGLSTLPQFRGQGYMGQLIQHAHKVMKERNIALSILVPAGDNLFDYYKKFGYEQISERSKEPIYPLKNILAVSPDLKTTYPIFVDTYCTGNLHVHKTFDDYTLIVEEYVNSNYEKKYNLGAMAHIVDSDALWVSIDKDKNQRKQDDTKLSLWGTTINFMLE